MIEAIFVLTFAADVPARVGVLVRVVGSDSTSDTVTVYVYRLLRNFLLNIRSIFPWLDPILLT